MWLYTSVGHFAPVADPNDSNLIIVRARRADDLNLLRRIYMPSLGPNMFEKGRDYNVRASISKHDFAHGLRLMALDIDYPSFKSMIHEKQPSRYAVYTQVWEATINLQDCAPPEKHKSIYASAFSED
jgi:hypothetical protein